MADSPEGYDVDAVEAWIRNNIDGLTPPFDWVRLEGGHSNLTYKLTDANNKEAVIRRPPLGILLPKAHDMSREWALISALGPTPVPVPTALGFCDSPSVTGAWFYVMGCIDGRPLYNNEETLEWIPEDMRTNMAHSFVDVLADLHDLDPLEIGLGELGKHDSYVGRQLKTWYRSWTSSVDGAQMDDSRAHELQQFFLDNLPKQTKIRVVHGDYGLHNCLIGANSVVAAVVDWEISTLGDPLADIAYALNTFPDPGDEIPIAPDAATNVPNMPTRSELIQRYAERTNRDVSNINYYYGFNRWKSACIVHGVYARYMQGNKSSEGVDLDHMRTRIESALTLAAQAVNRI